MQAFENEVNAHRQFEGSPYVVQRIDSCVVRAPPPHTHTPFPRGSNLIHIVSWL
jgi:hypothetical protein